MKTSQCNSPRGEHECSPRQNSHTEIQMSTRKMSKVEGSPKVIRIHHQGVMNGCTNRMAIIGVMKLSIFTYLFTHIRSVLHSNLHIFSGFDRSADKDAPRLLLYK